MVKGSIDSVETMGLVDGPGIRYVVFLQGCKLRCLFCHNPETWKMEEKNMTTAEELIDKIKRYKNYFGKEGGVTFSGGDPLCQPEFLLECLKQCKQEGIHTCLDTSGVGCNKELYPEILSYTDLVILDIKAVTPEAYKKMTGYPMKDFLEFLELCQKLEKKLWLRQVIVPGINDTEEYILELKKYIKNIKNVERVELLPYHLYGVEKYKKLGISYRLDGVPAMKKEDLDKLNQILQEN